VVGRLRDPAGSAPLQDGQRGADYRTSARVQIVWGLRYIAAVYGKPRIAWIHEVRDGWY
jgi:hypothetical protein